MRCFGALIFLICSATAYGQGCSQCRDTVSQTNPAVQGSYRTAIGIMLGAVAVVGTAGVVIIRRFR